MTSIEDLDGERWGVPSDGDTELARRCLALRTKSLEEFTVEDLRLMLGQQVAVPILLPRAVDVLMKSPLADGDYYPGDLLYAVVRLPDNAWDQLGVVRRRLADAIEPLAASGDVVEHLRVAIRQFVAAAPA